MMIPLDQLLAPVRADAPCGDDPWASGVLSELETAIQGRPETQFSAAEEPDWPRLRARVLEVAGTTKDLRVAAILAATLLRTDGLAGFAAGIKLMRRYLDEQWERVFPLLDAADGNDPSERVNAVANLAVAVGADGDLLRIIPGLRKLPLVNAPRAGRFGLQHYLVVRGELPAPADSGPAPTQALLEAAKQEVGAAAVAEVVTAARELTFDLKAIEQRFRALAGETQYPSLGLLYRELGAIEAWLGDGRAGPAPAGEAPAAVAGAAPETGAGTGWTGVVRSREDVLKAIDAIIEYYRRSEPSSPIPFLLQRAARIVPMDFLAMMNELTPEARDKIITLVGEIPTPPSP
jgi:type VI secretion system protein ImpA